MEGDFFFFLSLSPYDVVCVVCVVCSCDCGVVVVWLLLWLVCGVCLGARKIVVEVIVVCLV